MTGDDRAAVPADRPTDDGAATATGQEAHRPDQTATAPGQEAHRPDQTATAPGGNPGAGQPSLGGGLLPRWAIHALAVVIIGAFLLLLAQDVGRNGRSWLGWIDTTAVTTTDYQPLVSPSSIVYPKDFPTPLRLDHLPESITLRRIKSVAVYRLDDNVVAYSIRGNVARTDTSQNDLKAAVDRPGYKLDFWMGGDANNAGDFWIKWTVDG